MKVYKQQRPGYSIIQYSCNDKRLTCIVYTIKKGQQNKPKKGKTERFERGKIMFTVLYISNFVNVVHHQPQSFGELLIYMKNNKSMYHSSFNIHEEQ